MPQLEGPTTKIYNHVLGGFGEEKQGKKKKRLATVVSSGANLKKKKKERPLWSVFGEEELTEGGEGFLTDPCLPALLQHSFYFTTTKVHGHAYYNAFCFPPTSHFNFGS